MPKGHSIMGAKHAQVVRIDRALRKNVPVTYVTGTSTAEPYTLRIVNKLEQDLTLDDIDYFQNYIGTKRGVDPSTVVITHEQKYENVYF